MKYSVSAGLFLLALILPAFSYADGCSYTKTLYEKGQFSRAITIAKTHANYDNACAQYYLGIMYYKGQGTNVNYKLSSKYILKAIQQGYRPAMNFFKNKE